MPGLVLIDPREHDRIFWSFSLYPSDRVQHCNSSSIGRSAQIAPQGARGVSPCSRKPCSLQSNRRPLKHLGCSAVPSIVCAPVVSAVHPTKVCLSEARGGGVNRKRPRECVCRRICRESLFRKKFRKKFLVAEEPRHRGPIHAIVLCPSGRHLGSLAVETDPGVVRACVEPTS